MDDREIPPRQFANRVLKQVIQHMLSEDLVIALDDYMAMRVAFRKCGGSWFEVSQGNIVHLELLKKVVTAWGNMPGRKTTQDEEV